VLVFHDVLGLHDGHLPKFVRRYAWLADVAVEALERFYADVASGSFPGEAETYHMSEEAARMLVELEQAGPGYQQVLGDDLLADDAMDR
jgi:3-methyl-2-oxobutanoate hydroxymethyltransferase